MKAIPLCCSQFCCSGLVFAPRNQSVGNSPGVPSALQAPEDPSTGTTTKTPHQVCKSMSVAAMLQSKQLKLCPEDSFSQGLRRCV